MKKIDEISEKLHADERRAGRPKAGLIFVFLWAAGILIPAALVAVWAIAAQPQIIPWVSGLLAR